MRSDKWNGTSPTLRDLASNTPKEVVPQRGVKRDGKRISQYHWFFKMPVGQLFLWCYGGRVRVCLPLIDLGQLRCETGHFQNYLSKSTDASYRCGSSGPHWPHCLSSFPGEGITIPARFSDRKGKTTKNRCCSSRWRRRPLLHAMMPFPIWGTEKTDIRR